MKIQNKKKKSKVILIVILVVAFIVAGGASYWYLDANGFFGNKDKTAEQKEKSKTDVASDNPTDGQTPADEIGDNDNKGVEKPPVEVDANGKKKAVINIVDASQYDDTFEVRAGVTNLTEEGGKCEFVFTKGSQTLTRTTNAIFSGTRVDCETLDILVVDFPAKGEWQMVVKYTSAAAVGSSDSRTVTIK
jgi:cytoskeletal protein RodZ